jgi:hypothetical protein
MQEPEQKRARRKLIEFPDVCNGPVCCCHDPIVCCNDTAADRSVSSQDASQKNPDLAATMQAQGKAFIGVHMGRHDAVNSVLTSLVSVSQKTASLLVEAWGAGHSVCLIVSEWDTKDLFVRSFLFHDPCLFQNSYSFNSRGGESSCKKLPGGEPWPCTGLCTTRIIHDTRLPNAESRLFLSNLRVAVGPGTITAPSVQGYASLESSRLKNRIGPSEGRNFRVKWEYFGLFSDTLFKDLADRDKNVSINHFQDGSKIPPVRGFLYVWPAPRCEAANYTSADLYTSLLHATSCCNLSHTVKLCEKKPRVQDSLNKRLTQSTRFTGLKWKMFNQPVCEYSSRLHIQDVNSSLGHHSECQEECWVIRAIRLSPSTVAVAPKAKLHVM